MGYRTQCRIGLLCMSLLLVILPTQGRADIHYFDQLTFNTGGLGTQLSVTVAAVDTDRVSFLFQNDVGTTSSITDVYFYDGDYIKVPVSVEQSAGVSFSEPAAPEDVPGFKAGWTHVYSADSTSPVMANGIDSSAESLKLIFSLKDGQSLATVESAINAGLFVIGLHVQNIGPDGESDWYVTPVPGALLLGFLGLGCAGMKLRKFV